MLLLLIVAFIATGAFYQTAVANKKHPGKAASIPFVGLMVLLIANHFLMYFSGVICAATNASPAIISVVEFLNNIFMICVYFVFLRCNRDSLMVRVRSNKVDDL